jgi:hypothetical protein
MTDRPEPVAEQPSGFPHGQSAGKSTRPEPVATADLVAQARGFVGAFRATGLPDSADLMEQIAKALEDTAAERDELRIAFAQEAARSEFERGATDVLAAERDRAHATLEQIVSEAENHADAVHLARERLANP